MGPGTFIWSDDLKLKRFYVADLIACTLWAIALALLVNSVVLYLNR